MKFNVVVISILAMQASGSFLDKVRGIFQPPEYDIVNLVTDGVSDLQESIDCTIMAVENVFSLEGMFAINPEYERRCKSVTKHFAVTPTAEDTHYSQETKRGNENATNEISKHVKESLIDASSRLKFIVEKNEAQKRVQNTKSVIKNETDRLVVISRMIRRELNNLSPETKSKFNIHDIDLEHVSVHEVLGEIGALYKVEQSDISSSRANEIRHLFDKILNIVRVNKNDDRVYSDDDEVKEIVKNLEKTENNTLINTEEKLSLWKDGNLQNNIVHSENINKLQKEIDDIPKNFQDIAKKIFSQGSANGIRRSNASEIINTLNLTPEVNIQNMDVKRNIQNTAKQIINESKTININQILKSNQQARNIFNQSIKEQNCVSSESFHKNKDKILKLSMEQKQNVNITNKSQDTANHVLEESHIVDTDQIVKSTAEAINIISQSDKQEQKYYVPNMAQTSVNDIADKKNQNIDIIKNFQHTASQIVEESKTRDKRKEHGQSFVSNSAQEKVSNALEASKKQKENVNVTNSFESITNQVMEDLKPVDTDQIVKSAEEATKIFSQSANEQQKYYDSNIEPASIDDIFKDSEKEYQNIDVANSFQNAVSHIMEESKTENATKDQEQAFVSNSIQKSVNNIFEDSRKQEENVDIVSSFQSIANEVTEKVKPVDTDQIVKSTEEATNIFSQSANEQQKYYDSNVVQASVFQNNAIETMEESKTVDSAKEQQQAFISNNIQESANNIFEDSEKQKENVDIASSFQSIANEAVEVSKPVDIDQIVKSTEEGTYIYSQSTNEQQNYYVSNIVQASVDDIFKDSEKEYQNIGDVNSFQNAASQIIEESKTENTTKEQEQAFVSNSIQESVNNMFEDSRKQEENVDIASSFQSIANEVIENVKPVDTDQIVKSIEEATNIFSQSANEQQKYYDSNIVQASVFQNNAIETMEESKTVDSAKEQQQAFISNNIQESANNIFEDSGKQKENVDIASSFQSIANEAIEVSKPVDIDQIVKSTEEGTNIYSQSTNEQQNYYVSNIIQSSVDDIFKDSEKEYQNISDVNSFQNAASQIIEESKTENTTEQEQAFVSNSIQESVNTMFEDSRKQEENVDIASSFQSIANEVIEKVKPVDTDQIVKSTEEATNIFSQSADGQQKYYDSNIEQASVDDLFTDSEREYQNIDIANSFQNAVSQIMEELKTENATKEQEQAFVSNSIQENANNIFDDSRKQKENLDLANSFQSIANEVIEKSKPVDTDQTVKTIEEAINIFSQSANEQQKYYDSNIEQASVLQNTASKIMEEPKTVDSTKEQEQVFVSNRIQESANNIFEDSRKQKEKGNIASSVQSITNQVMNESKPVDVDQILKLTKEAINVFSPSTFGEQKYYVSNHIRARVDEIFKDTEKKCESVDITKNFLNTASGTTEESKTENTIKEQEQAFVSNSIHDSTNNSFEDSKKQKRTADLVNSFQSIANEAIEVSEPVDTDQIVKSTEEATNIFNQSNNELQNYYVSNIIQSSVDDTFKDSEKEYQNISDVNSFQNAASQIIEESKTENTTEQEQAFVSNSIQESVNNMFEDSRKQEENVDIASSFQSIANEVIEKVKPVDTDQIVKTIEEATNIFSQSANEQQTHYVSNNVQASVDDLFTDSEREYQNIDVVNSFQNAASQIIEESKTENTTEEQEQVFDSNNTQGKATNTFEDLEQRKEDVDIVNSFQSITNQLVEESKPVDTDQIVKLTEEAKNIFNQSTNEQNSFQNTVSQITEETVTVDSTKSQDHAFVSNDVQVNKTLENTKKEKENLNVVNSFQTIANQTSEELKSVYKQQIVNSTKETMNISQSTKDQQKNSHSSQDNLNKTFKQPKSEVPQPSVPAHSQGLNGIGGINPPINKNYMSTTLHTHTTSVPAPAVTSAHTTTTTTTEIPDYDDYDEDTDGLSLLSQLFGSGSEEDNVMRAKEAESIIKRSSYSKEFFNKVNRKNALNVFDNPDLL